jgi:hypothetical protein
VSVEEAEATVDWMIKEEYWHWFWDSDLVRKRREWVNLLSNRSTKNGTTHLDSLLFEELKWRYGYFFRAEACWKVGRKIAEGGQAYIYKPDMMIQMIVVIKLFTSKIAMSSRYSRRECLCWTF